MSDEDIWESYAKGVQKLTPREEKTKSEKKAKLVCQAKIKEQIAEKKAKEVFVEPPPKPQAPPSQPEMLDLRVERNLSLGDVVIEAKLDLHGKTEEAAHEALLVFVDKQYSLQRRVLLVITGKGKDGMSVLRMNFPRWCEVSPLAEKILALRTAAPHHGGEGAYYLLLRKKK